MLCSSDSADSAACVTAYVAPASSATILIELGSQSVISRDFQDGNSFSVLSGAPSEPAVVKLTVSFDLHVSDAKKKANRHMISRVKPRGNSPRQPLDPFLTRY